METTKTKVIDIQTGKAQKGVKSLKQVIKELRDEMALLEKGTAEYDAMSKKLADAMQKQREIAEAAKYSNKDIGATLGNIATVGAGAVGAINGVSAALQLVGVSGEDAEEALKNIQLTMALIQGMSALDTALKAIKGLGVAFKGLNTERITNTGTTLAAAGAEGVEAAALVDNTKKTYENINAAKDYTKIQTENTTATDKSTEALYNEAKGLEAVAAARQGDMTKLEQYRAELASLEAQQAAAKETGISNTKKVVTGGLEQLIKDNEEMLAKLPNGNATLEREISEYKKLLQSVKDGTMSTSEAMSMAWRKLSYDLSEAIDNMADPTEISKIESWMNSVAMAMSPEEIQNRIDSIQETMEGVISRFYEMYPKEMVDNNEMLRNMLNDQTEAYRRQLAQLQPLYIIKTSQAKQERQLKNEIIATTEAENAETASLNVNTKAKQQNAGATNAAAGAEGNLAKSTKATIPLTTKLGNAIKNAGKGIMEFVKANPILLTIVASIGAVAGAMALIANATKKALKDVREMREMAAQLNYTYEDQTVRLNVLLNTAQDETQSLNERKKAVEELNKIVPNYNAQLDETTGEYTASATALQHYIDKLKEKIELEAYEGKIKELLQGRLDLEQKLIKAQTNGWNIFGIKVNKLKKQIKETDEQIEKLYGRIQDLYLPWALDENKVDTGNTVKTVVKTFKEVFAQLKTMYENLWNTIFDEKELRLTFNGVYSETDIMLSKIQRIIKSKDLGKYITDEFKNALDKGFPEDMNYQITLDWVFDKKQSQEFYAELAKENNKLVQMMNSKKPVSDDELKAQQAVIDKLKEEEANRKLVMEATQKYFEQRRKEADENDKLVNAKEQYLKQLEIERTFKLEQRSSNTYADINKEIATNELLVKQIEDRMAERQGELNWLKSLPDQNKQVLERIKVLNQEQIDDEKAKNAALANIDEQNYKTRLQYLQDFYDGVDAEQASRESDRNMQRTLAGWGVQDYNTELDNLVDQYNAVMQKIAEVNAYYAQQVKDGLLDEVEAEMEKNAVIEQLQLEASEKAVAIKEAEIARKIAISETYVSAYQAVTGEINQLLSAEMSMYDQNSKQYKNLAYTQGVVDVTSGTLAAFMSGIKSGIPAPYNLILAAAMAATTFTTGLIQLQAIKKNSLENTTASGSKVSFGSTYDTLAYAQNADILSAIGDSKVYVLESDVSSTQKKVSVIESNATF